MKILVSDPTFDNEYYGRRASLDFETTCSQDGSLAGDYWEFSDGNNDYYIWYTEQGIGNDPSLANKTGIEVALTTNESRAEVAEKTWNAVDSSSANVILDVIIDNQLAFYIDYCGSVTEPNADNIDWDIDFQNGTDSIQHNFEKISDYNYQVNGDFSVSSCSINISSYFHFTITGGLIYYKDGSKIKLLTTDNDMDGVSWSCDDDMIVIRNYTGHAISMRDNVDTEVSGVIDSSDIFIVVWEITKDFTDLCDAQDIKVITRSTDGLTDSLLSEADKFNEVGTGWVYSHGGNSHSNTQSGWDPPFTTKLDLICAVGAGDNLGNTDSYSDGLEFYLNCESYGVTVNQSNAASIVGGMIAKLLVNHPTWNFHDARQALRQTASNWNTGWSIELIESDTRDKGGFGAVDYTSANALTDSELLSMSPLRQEITVNSNNVQFTWLNSPQNNFSETVIAKFVSEPNRDTMPTENQIIYQGTDESYTYENYGDIGTVWFVFHTLDTNGNYSKVESYDKEEVSTNQSFTSDVQIQLINSGNKSSLVESVLL